MTDEEKLWQEYQAALGLTQSEEATAWQRFTVFLFSNLILLSATLWQQEGIPHFILPAFGLILGFLWLAISIRGFSYQLYYFRYAREIERKLSHSDIILRATLLGEKHLPVEVDTMTMRMPWVGRWVKGRHAAYAIVGMFIVIYTGLAIRALTR